MGSPESWKETVPRDRPPPSLYARLLETRLRPASVSLISLSRALTVPCIVSLPSKGPLLLWDP